MLTSVGSSVLVWGTKVSMGVMFINLIVKLLELHVVNTVIPSILLIFVSSPPVLFIQPLTCSPGRLERFGGQNSNFGSSRFKFRVIAIQKKVTSHFRVIQSVPHIFN